MNEARIDVQSVLKAGARFGDLLVAPRYVRLSRSNGLKNHRRIYHIHVRKTAGTSINKMFLALSGRDPERLYTEIATNRTHRIVADRRVYVGWRRTLINRGNYFYAFSHVPLHQLKLPPDTLTFTCLRDPISRVVSHYNMLRDMENQNSDHRAFQIERSWLGKSFSDFIDRIPAEHLQNQLYMFSSKFDVGEAVSRIAELDLTIAMQDFESGVASLNEISGLTLRPVHQRQSAYGHQLSETEHDQLRTMLDKEYELLDRVNALRQS